MTKKPKIKIGTVKADLFNSVTWTVLPQDLKELLQFLKDNNYKVSSAQASSLSAAYEVLMTLTDPLDPITSQQNAVRATNWKTIADHLFKEGK